MNYLKNTTDNTMNVYICKNILLNKHPKMRQDKP